LQQLYKFELITIIEIIILIFMVLMVTSKHLL